MPLISKKVRNGVVSILSDATRGFNPTYAALVAGTDYGALPAIIVDFASTSANFIQSQVTAQQLDESSNFEYPLMALYTLGIEDTKDRKFAVFAGLIQIALDVFVSQENNEAVPDTETVPDAIEDAMYTIFNGSSFAPSVLQSNGIIYNGDISLARGQVQQAGENWLQQLAFRMTFQL